MVGRCVGSPVGLIEPLLIVFKLVDNKYFFRTILSMMSKLKPEGSNAAPLHAHLVRVESGH